MTDDIVCVTGNSFLCFRCTPCTHYPVIRLDKINVNDDLLRKIEIQFCFLLLWRSRSFINWSQQFLQHTDSSRRFQCDRWSFDSPYILIDESTGTTVSKKLIILSTYSLGGVRLYFCTIRNLKGYCSSN